ncbi:hypothetical protein [Nitrospira sp. Nam80]
MSAQHIDYRAVLADLEAKKAAIEASIAGIKMMMFGEVEGHAAGTSMVKAHSGQKLASNTFSKMGAVEAAEHYLRLVGELKTTAEIVTALEDGGIVHQSQDFRKTVSTILNSKARDVSSEITKVKDKWGLSSWGPGLKRAKNANLGMEPEPSAEEVEKDVLPSQVAS